MVEIFNTLVQLVTAFLTLIVIRFSVPNGKMAVLNSFIGALRPGASAQARRSWLRAVAILDEIGAAGAAELRLRLDQAEAQGPAARRPASR